MEISNKPQSIVEEWKKKSLEISTKSNDCFVSLLSKGIEAMAVVLNKESSQANIVSALAYLEFERTLSLQFDRNKNDVVRSLWYGTIESLHFTLSELNKERNQMKECGKMFPQTYQESSHPSLDYHFASNEFVHNAYNQSLDDQSGNPNWFEIPKEKSLDGNSIKIEDYWEIDTTMKDTMADEKMEEKNRTRESGAEIDQDRKDSETAELNKKRSSSIMISNAVKFNDLLNDSDGDSEPSMKKPKSTKMEKKKSSDTIEEKGELDSMKSSKKKGEGKINASELKCPECEYRGKTAQSLQYHLRDKHSTTLALAGFALRCDCGAEVLSSNHIYICKIANFVLVRKRDGPIRKKTDDKTTPQCILCDAFPKTAAGYNAHLRIHHKTSLSSNGIYLLCSCGAKYRYGTPDSKHTNECNRREYTLHKRDKE